MDGAQKLQSCFQTLADANRLRIIKFIGEKEYSVSEIVKATGLSQPLVSHHLRTLRNRQFLEAKRQGAFVYYRLKDNKLLAALGLFSDIANSMSDEKMGKPFFHCPPFWKMKGPGPMRKKWTKTK
ncbi:ArsR/SmtB family transcription factor [Thermodesulfobacteriota bacterium]